MNNMNRWAHGRSVKCTALFAALALALAPVDLLAFCGCRACGCAAAVEDSPGCCCTEKSQPGHCCQPVAAPTPDGCSCSKSVPASPVGTLPVKTSGQNQQAPAIALALLPPIAEIDTALHTSLTQDQPLWPVPARILLCVWRN